MNRKSFVHAMLLAIVSGLLTVVAGGNAHSQGRDFPTEKVTFVYGDLNAKTVNIQISIKTSGRQQFLDEPVSTLRLQGITVPPKAETPWREFTLALRKLANPQVAKPAGRRDTMELEYVILSFGKVPMKMTGVVVTIVGAWNADGTATEGARRNSPDRFLADPVASLRAQGVNVPSADEPAWRQLAAALKALRLEYANSRVNANLERQSSTNSESTATKPTTRIGIGLPTKQATQDQLAREIRQQLISRGVTVSEQEVQGTATRALDLIGKAKDPEKGVIYVHTKKFTFCVSWGKDKAFCNNQ